MEWTASVDSTINRAHQHAVGARKRGVGGGRTGRSGTRGGWSGARSVPRRAGHQGHLACDGRGLPLAVVVPPGNVNDSTAFDAVLDAVRVPRTGVGRPRRRPDAVIADKAYSSRAIRQTPCGAGASGR